ncbi:hypothetical protein N802_06275 [Knoellia sinensis KCTC 19936]|uniref:TIGR02588 family protein n=1 Tax=Knoellia sinensis KCTC 19936 TaxID=1385520 RepID=A0A0A0J3V3_9MICO|nr:hypothetical protein [Knoellia sinensis]KGN30812.1 hypothetical protein N802_06275 [Knoellia sinensis KCTC 19936]
MNSPAAQRTSQSGRTSAEWATFVVSCLVLAVVALLVVSRMVGDRDPARPEARISGVTQVGGQSHVGVEVRNAGDDTAANVAVRLEFQVDGEKDDAEQTVDFLAADEKVSLVFVLPEGASADDLAARATGFTQP